jgi:hypothetical protein
MTVILSESYREDIDIVKEIPVVLTQTGEDFLAAFYPAHIEASGDTKAEAMTNLLDLLCSGFVLLSREETSLGAAAKRQLGVLRKHMRLNG